MATRNLGQVSAIHIGTVEPQNKDLIWRDASQNPRLWKVWNSVTSVWEVVPSQAVANNFLNLGDTPVSYTGSGGKILKVKANLSGIEFVDETTYSSEIDAAIDKAVLSDSDEFLLSDAGTVKKTKWSQIKSSLKSYFDTLYVSVSTVTSQLIQNWNEAFSWGDHSLEGYLTNETDPIFTSHPASSVVNSGDGTKYLADDGVYKEVSGGLASIAEETNEAIREIEKYENGNDVFNFTTGSLYEYDSAETETDDNDNFLKPNNSTGSGRWVKVGVLGAGHIFEDSTGSVLPTRSVAKAGDGIEFEDDAVNEMTVVRVDDKVSTKPDSFTENHIKTFDEDGNDKDSGIDITQLNTNQTVEFSDILPFDHVLTVMQPHAVTGSIHFTANSVDLVDGAKIIVVLTANGTNIPTFGAEFTESSDSLQYSNIPNDKNTIEFLYDGDGFWYRVINNAGSNLAYKNQVLLTTNETPYTPEMDYNPTTKKYVDEKIVEYVANYYPGIPSPEGQELGYYGIKWNSAYPNSGCLRTGTLSGYQGGGYYGEQAYNLGHRPLSNVPNNLLFIQNKMRRCTLNVNGTVNYYLDPNNSYNKYGESPSVFGTITTAGRTSVVSTGTFALAASSYVGRYIHITTSSKANIYAMVTNKVSDDELTVIDPRRGVTTGDIFEIGDAFELCTAVLDGSEGDAMVQVPKFYIRFTRSGGLNTLDISLYPYDGFNVHPAFVESGVEKDFIYYGAFGAYLSGGVGVSRAEAVPTTSRTRAANRNDAATKGTGWAQEMFWYRSAIQVLFFVEYADLNSDFRLPAFQHRSSFSINDIRYTGRTLFAGDNSVSIFQDTSFYDTNISIAGWTANDCVGMSYRGIENFYGSLWNWTDGINLDSGQVYLTNNKSVLADDTAGGYDNPNLVWLQQTSFIRQVHPVAGAFIPSLGGGSASTYFCDQNYYATGWRVVYSGGGSYNGLFAGAVCWSATLDSSIASALVGSRLCF